MTGSNERRSVWRTRALLGVVVALGIVSGGYLTAIASGEGSSPEVGAPITDSPTPAATPDTPLDDCATTDFSILTLEDQEVNTGFNAETRVLEMSARDTRVTNSNDVTFRVGIDDPACQAVPIVKMKIDEAIQIFEEGLATECPAIQGYVDTGAATNERGEPIDLEAAQTFLDEWCNGVSPSPSVSR